MILNSEQDTLNYGKEVANSLEATDIITLYGNLGAGKTMIAREIIKYFCGETTIVTSPTFNILQTYQAPNFMIYHYDLYRVKSLNEIYELGIEEAFNHNLCLIEWPEIIESLLPKPYIKIELKHQGLIRLCFKSIVS